MRLTPWMIGIAAFALTCQAWSQPHGAGFDSLEWMVADSDVVATGHIVSIKEDDGFDGQLSYWDTVTVQVDQTFKGDPAKDLTFRVSPDYWSTKHEVYSKPGESVMVFLVESSRLDSRAASQFRFALRGRFPRGGFIDLDEATHPLVINEKLEAVPDRASLIQQTQAIVVNFRNGRYQAKQLKPKFAEVPKYFRQGGFGWVSVMVPDLLPNHAAWPREQASRFGFEMDYDGSLFARGESGKVSLWNSDTGSLIQMFPTGSGSPHSIALSPDDMHLLAGTDGKEPEIVSFSIESGSVEMNRSIGGRVDQLAYAPSGDSYASMSIENYGNSPLKLRFRDTFDGLDQMMFPGEGLRFSNDGSMILTNGGERGPWVGVWDAKTFLQLSLIKGDDKAGKRFFSAEFSPYGNRVVTTCVYAIGNGYESAVEVWDATTGKRIWSTVGSRMRKAVFTRDGTRVVAASRDSAILVCDAESGKILKTIECPQYVTNILVSRDGKRCLATWVTGNRDTLPTATSLFDLESGNELRRIDFSESEVVGFSRDGKTYFGFTHRADSKDIGTTWSSGTGGVLRSIILKR